MTFHHPQGDLEILVQNSEKEILEFSTNLITTIKLINDEVLSQELIGVCSQLLHLLSEYYRTSGEADHIHLRRLHMLLYRVSRTTTKKSKTVGGNLS